MPRKSKVLRSLAPPGPPPSVNAALTQLPERSTPCGVPRFRICAISPAGGAWENVTIPDARIAVAVTASRHMALPPSTTARMFDHHLAEQGEGSHPAASD